MAPDYKFHDGIYPTCLLQNLFELQDSGSLCDVTLCVNGDEIKAHKVILSSASPYFRAMFTSGLKETKQDCIEMHEVEFSALKDIIRFFYTTEIEVTEDNVYNLMEVTDLLQVSAVRAACSHYLLSTLNASNCLSVYVRAVLRSYNDLAHKAFRYILHNFKCIMQEEEFLYVPPDTLLRILDSRLLNVADEGQLLEGVLHWWKHDRSERTHHLKPLIAKLNLERVPMERLLGFKTDPLLADTQLLAQINETVNMILAQRYDNGDIKTLWEMRHKTSLWRERYSMEQEVILAIGGESSGMALSSVECFTLGYDSWKCIVPTAVQEGEPCEDTRVIPTMHHARFYAAVAAKDYVVFVVGGTNSSTVLDVVEYYSIQSNVWSDLAPLPIAVQGAGAVILDQQLHVVGGRGKNKYENRVWVYEENQNSWQELPPMNKCRGHHGVVTVGGSIFAIGGIGGEENNRDMYLKSMEKYDRGRNQWFNVAPMHEERASFGCAAVDEFIYVMGGYDGTFWSKSVERYNTLTNEWSYMTPMSTTRSHFSTTVSNNRIYCLGGHDSIHYLNTVEKFNPQTNRWHCVQAMQVRRYGVGAATLFIPVMKETAY
ncbi:kelch-like protein diablo [Periplaneta americana]|uniref:kelch-like protein diablo n=1 Tax=Periplaneta americana TaxID=6978 RepID=UPI0037E89282